MSDEELFNSKILERMNLTKSKNYAAQQGDYTKASELAKEELQIKKEIYTLENKIADEQKRQIASLKEESLAWSNDLFEMDVQGLKGDKLKSALEKRYKEMQDEFSENFKEFKKDEILDKDEQSELRKGYGRLTQMSDRIGNISQEDNAPERAMSLKTSSAAVEGNSIAARDLINRVWQANGKNDKTEKNTEQTAKNTAFLKPMADNIKKLVDNQVTQIETVVQ
jgi:hypothetical protein